MTCSYHKRNGKPCGSHTMQGVKLCWFHNPAIPESERQTARVRGGRNNAVKTDKVHALLAEPTPKGTVAMLAQTINEVRSGEIDIRIANCLGFLAGHLIRAFEVAEFDERISQLEHKVSERFDSQTSQYAKYRKQS